MLRRINIQNFYSIYEPVEISLMLHANVAIDYRSAPTIDNKRVSKLLALIGANGSGKTNILRALAFVHWFIGFSFTHLQPDEKLPVTPHFSGQNEPTTLEVEFDYKNHVWRYDLMLNTQRVLHESLHRRNHNNRFIYIFKRDWNNTEHSYDIRMKEEFDFSAKEAQKVRENTSLIATAAQYNQPLARSMTRLNMTSNLTEMGRYSFSAIEQILDAAKRYHEQADTQQTMQDLLNEWDLGLSGISVKANKHTNKKGQEQTFYIPYGQHEINGKQHELPLYDESSGTQTAFTLLSRLLPILKSGGLAVIDEMESDLHPHMLEELIDLFISPETNPHNAQLVFSTHSHALLNTLLKQQIVLVEKDDELNTDAYRLDDVKGVRADDNIYAKYLAGAYGAIPNLS